jgi:heme-degrading monooxygenase HmoA
MIYLNVRHTVADYEKWRVFFDGDDVKRRAAGATGATKVYRDADDANTVTTIIEWDNAENARKFMNDPALREVMQKAGVVGMPAVRAILLPA